MILKEIIANSIRRSWHERLNISYMGWLLLSISTLLTLFCGASLAATEVSTISGNTSWTQAGSPYVVTGNISVNSGATLTIDPGVVVKLKTGRSITVTGTGALVTNGTASEKVVFTSYKDDSYGGDTNGDGTVTVPVKGDWGYVYFSSTSGASQIRNTIFRYGGMSYPMVRVYNSSPLFDGCTFENAYNIALSITGNSLPVVQGSTFRSNTIHISYNSTSISTFTPVNNNFIGSSPVFGIENMTTIIIVALNNYWGSSSGPTHASNPAGTGVRISNYVDYAPFYVSEVSSLLPENGTCGTSNGGTFITAPTTNLCSAGTATSVSGSGLWSWSCLGSHGGTTDSCSALLKTSVVKGDINGDGIVNLADAIMALQVLVGTNLNLLSIRSDYISAEIDVNGDNKIGLSEAIYAFQEVAGLRVESDVNLVGYYTFDDSSPNDFSGLGNNPTTIEGNPTYTGGRTTGAINFDGINDRFLIPNSTSTSNVFQNGYTIAAWIYPIGVDAGIHNIVSKGRGGFSLRLNGSTLEACHMGELFWGCQIGANSNVVLNQWQHVAVTWDKASGKWQIYLNSIAADYTGTETSLQWYYFGNLSIGADDLDQQDYFKGYIDSVRIYSRGLSANEIAMLYDLTQ